MSKPMILRRTFRICFRLLLALLLLPLPALAQGPRPVGMQRMKPGESVSPSRDLRVHLRDNGRGTAGFFIGFAVGLVGTILVASVDGRTDTTPCSDCRGGNSKAVGAVAFAVGLVGGFIGYLVGRRY